MIAPQARRSTPRWTVVATLVAAVALVLAGCSDDGGDEATDAGSSDTTVTTAAPDSSETTAGEPVDGTTTTPPGSETTGTTEVVPGEPDPGLAPGDPCSLTDGVPDCIDPDGDGEGTYLIGGDQCAAEAPDISICEDLDQDGNAGYPDEFEDLPTCSDEVAPPCNNEPSEGEPEEG